MFCLDWAIPTATPEESTAELEARCVHYVGWIQFTMLIKKKIRHKELIAVMQLCGFK